MGWDETSDARGLSNLYDGAHSAVKWQGIVSSLFEIRQGAYCQPFTTNYTIMTFFIYLSSPELECQ